MTLIIAINTQHSFLFLISQYWLLRLVRIKINLLGNTDEYYNQNTASCMSKILKINILECSNSIYGCVECSSEKIRGLDFI